MRPGTFLTVTLLGGSALQVAFWPATGIASDLAPDELVVLVALATFCALPCLLGLLICARIRQGRYGRFDGAEWLLATAVTGPLGTWLSRGAGHNAVAELIFIAAVQLAFVAVAWIAAERGTQRRA